MREMLIADNVQSKCFCRWAANLQITTSHAQRENGEDIGDDDDVAHLV